MSICTDCNGTLSALESAVSPILSPLVQSHGAFLNVRDQRLIGAWAAKAVLMNQVKDGGYEAFDSQREQLIRKPLWPPDFVRVQLGQFNGPAVCITRTDGILHMDLPMSVPVAPNAYAACLAFGGVVLHVCGSPFSYCHYDTSEFPLVQIWPAPRPIIWPPGMDVFLDGGIEQLASIPKQHSADPADRALPAIISPP